MLKPPFLLYVTPSSAVGDETDAMSIPCVQGVKNHSHLLTVKRPQCRFCIKQKGRESGTQNQVSYISYTFTELFAMKPVVQGV